LAFPPTDPDAVEVYRHLPPTPHDVIGEVEASGNAWAGWEAVGAELRRKAASIGGDAVVIEQMDTPQVGALPQYAPPPPEQVVVSSSQDDQYDLYSTSGQRIGTARRRSGVTFVDPYQSYDTRPVGYTPIYGKSASGVVIRFKQEAP
jgi:hypothetical protein